MNDQQLKMVYPVSALFGNFSEKQLDRWYDLMWDGRERYLNGESTDIHPCMYGDFWHQRRKYMCTKDSIIGLLSTERPC